MTVLGYLLENIENRPNALALRSTSIDLTYKELGSCIVNFLNNLKRYKEDEIVVLSLQDSMKWVIALLALLFRGQWVLLVPGDFQLTELKDYDLSLQSLQDFSVDKTVAQEKYSCLVEPVNTSGIYQVTSGSTGKPSLCRRTLQNLTREGLRYKDCFQLTKQDKIINIPPLYHSFSLGAALVTSVICGSPLTLVNAVSPKKIHRLVKEHWITFMVVVPNIAKLFVLTDKDFRSEYETVRTVLAGAGAISKELDEKFHDIFGVSLSGNYGSTETGALFSRMVFEPMQSIGKAMMGVSYIIKDELGNKVYTGGIGELWVRYEGLENNLLEANRFAMDEDGYYPMGDLVTEDDENHLFVVGRKKLMINMGGKKVYPIEIENMIKACPNVVDCVVLPYKKQNQDIRVKAFVAGTLLREEDVRQYCKSKLPSYKIPSKIQICEHIPRNEIGKVKYFDLEEM